MASPSSLRAHADADVLIIGAGISGISAACHLAMHRPDDEVVILEGRQAIGGTWDLFRYPGVRSDSDMTTLGFGFRPWDGEKAIAPGASIRDYIQDTAEEHDVVEKIRFGRRVTSLSFDSATALWTAVATLEDGTTETVTAGHVHSCTGYYDYEEGFTPDFDGVEDFAGQLIHPQAWPEDFDATDKRIVVIGSGATAMTLIPNLAPEAQMVTMLQRTPTYVASLPDTDPIGDVVRRVLPSRMAHQVVSAKNQALTSVQYELAQRAPGLMKRLLIGMVTRQLPDGFDVDQHFTPDYDPWDQRVCLVPNGDLFKAIRRGKADVVTDTIDRFVPEGILLASGEVLEADVVVTATGLQLKMVGGIDLTVDGRSMVVPDRTVYKAMMLSGIPNLSFAIGYVNASWTLRIDLVSRFLCRLLDHMERKGHDIATPLEPDADVERAPMIEMTSGYFMRSRHLMPQQARRSPWRVHQNVVADRILLGARPVEDEGLAFSRSSHAVDAEQPTLVA